MYLHENIDDFKQLVAATSVHFNRATPFIIKDYFAVTLLKELIASNADLVFKGGTCLSKCYGVIARFSEDIDLGIEEEHATEGMRKRIKTTERTSVEKLGLSIPNLSSTRSRREYNRYEIPLPSLSSVSGQDLLIVETAVMTPAAPTEIREIQSFIGEYCSAAKFEDALEEYQLNSFNIRSNSMERTFCDKVFALCDYFLSGEIPTRQSRHIYDLRKLSGAIHFDSNFIDLMATVRKQRAGKYHCYSANDQISIPDVLEKIILTNAYKSDYEDLTVPLLYENLPYEEAISALEKTAAFLRQDARFA